MAASLRVAGVCVGAALALGGCPAADDRGDAPKSPPVAKAQPKAAARAAAPAAAPAKPKTQAAPARPRMDEPYELVAGDPDFEGVEGLTHSALEEADALRRAVVRGDLPGVAAAGRRIGEAAAKHSAPDSWAPHLTAMARAGQEAAEAKVLTAAARASAEAAAVCGECHRAMKIDLKMAPPGDPPAESADRAAHMVRHAWASWRLWQGIVGPSDTHWIAGAQALAGASLSPGKLSKTQTSLRIAHLGSKVHDLGARARETYGAGERTKLYGELLATCSVCHAAAGAPPPPANTSHDSPGR